MPQETTVHENQTAKKIKCLQIEIKMHLTYLFRPVLKYTLVVRIILTPIAVRISREKILNQIYGFLVSENYLLDLQLFR